MINLKVFVYLHLKLNKHDIYQKTWINTIIFTPSLRWNRHLFFTGAYSLYLDFRMMIFKARKYLLNLLCLLQVLLNPKLLVEYYLNKWKILIIDTCCMQNNIVHFQIDWFIDLNCLPMHLGFCYASWLEYLAQCTIVFKISGYWSIRYFILPWSNCYVLSLNQTDNQRRICVNNWKNIMRSNRK